MVIIYEIGWFKTKLGFVSSDAVVSLLELCQVLQRFHDSTTINTYLPTYLSADRTSILNLYICMQTSFWSSQR